MDITVAIPRAKTMQFLVEILVPRTTRDGQRWRIGADNTIGRTYDRRTEER
jgi:hypothetical protein